jgi:hypothetical protein
MQFEGHLGLPETASSKAHPKDMILIFKNVLKRRRRQLCAFGS